jgi:LIVCS family branched-chain amino acid:cation transporter
VADALEAAGMTQWPFTMTRQLPLHNQGLAWLLPVLAVMFVAAAIDRLIGAARPVLSRES